MLKGNDGEDLEVVEGKVVDEIKEKLKKKKKKKVVVGEENVVFEKDMVLN